MATKNEKKPTKQTTVTYRHEWRLRGGRLWRLDSKHLTRELAEESRAEAATRFSEHEQRVVKVTVVEEVLP